MFRVPKSLIQQLDTSKWNATSLEARDIKLKITNIDIPWPSPPLSRARSSASGDMQVEVDGSRVDCFELVQTRKRPRWRITRSSWTAPSWTRSPSAPRFL